jgi:hypothetical protein
LTLVVVSIPMARSFWAMKANASRRSSPISDDPGFGAGRTTAARPGGKGLKRGD